MHVRSATSDDARLIADLNVVVQDLHYKAHPEHFTPTDSGAVVAMFSRLLANPNVWGFVAEDASGAIGYALAVRHERRASPLTRATVFLELDQIAVLPNRERKGAGSALAGAVLQLAVDLEIPRVELSVWEFNARAQRFFTSLGFAPTQRRMTKSN